MSKSSDYRQELTNQIIEMLEKGTAPWQSGWQINDSRLFNRPYNPHSEKAYRGMNSLYLTIVSGNKNYNDPRWCTFKQANEQGWRIKAGEHGKVVEFWKFTEKKEFTDKNGDKVLKEVPLSRPMVIRSVVFNAEQMTGVPPLEKKEPNLWEAKNRAEKILANSGAVIEHKPNITPHYSIRDDKIMLPEREQFKNAAIYYATALHELGHWTGAENRLNRDMWNIFGTPGYAREELRAELSSFFTASELGIPNEIERHASYLDNWIKALKEDKNEIFKAAADAEKITDYVLQFEKEKALNQEKTVGHTEKDAYALKQETPNFAKADIRLMVDYKNRQEAKELGAKWDKELKTWYAPKGENLNKFSAFMGDKTVNLLDTVLSAAYEEKDAIKALGGIWNADKKEWYIPAGSDIKNVPEKFFKEHAKQSQAIDNKPSFAEFAREHGLLLEGEPIADGKFHRVPVEDGKPRAKDGSYVYFSDAGGNAGWIKNFKTGFESSYGETKGRSGEIRRLSAEEREAREAERKAGYDVVAKKADYLVSKVFKKAETHPYLEAKGVKPHNTLVDKDGTLIIPLTNSEGKIRTFQRIDADGTKGYIKGGEKAGTYYSFGSPKDKMLICEGFATGASLYEATRIPTLAAMDAGNIERVAADMRAKYGDNMKITIAADNDHATVGNPGVTYAQKAAAAVKASVVIPQFNETEKAGKLTDFNDLAQSKGKEAVKEQIYAQDKELMPKIKELER